MKWSRTHGGIHRFLNFSFRVILQRSECFGDEIDWFSFPSSTSLVCRFDRSALYSILTLSLRDSWAEELTKLAGAVCMELADKWPAACPLLSLHCTASEDTAVKLRYTIWNRTVLLPAVDARIGLPVRWVFFYIFLQSVDLQNIISLTNNPKP